MKLRNRILLFNLATFSLVLLLVGTMSYIEFREQKLLIEKHLDHELESSPAFEAFEIVAGGGTTALLLALIFSRLFLHRALAPITQLTTDLEQTSMENLSKPIERSENGDEIDRMAHVFNELKKRLDLSFTQTRDFTMHASHELKTPLAIMHGTLEQMLLDDLFPADQKRKIASMLEEVQRLSRLTEQLIFLAKADAFQMPLKKSELSLDDLVRELRDDCIELGRHQQIQVELLQCDPLRLWGDKMRMRQLLLNLADNAVKYNQPHGVIRISLRNFQGFAQFSIANLGRPIQEKERQRIFERFFRCDSSHDSVIEGTGLGLSICQMIVQLHHGTIRYELDAEVSAPPKSVQF